MQSSPFQLTIIFSYEPSKVIPVFRCCITFLMLCGFLGWLSNFCSGQQRTGSAQFKWKGPRVAHTFSHNNSPNSRALTGRNGRIEQLWLMSSSDRRAGPFYPEQVLRTCVFHLRSDWSGWTDGKWPKWSTWPRSSKTVFHGTRWSSLFVPFLTISYCFHKTAFYGTAWSSLLVPLLTILYCIYKTAFYGTMWSSLFVPFLTISYCFHKRRD